METPYMVLVSETGAQLLCLSNGTRIPNQIETYCSQNVDQSTKGICRVAFSLHIKERHGVSYGCTWIDNFSLQMPDGLVIDLVYAIKGVSEEGAPIAHCSTTAKMVPTTVQPLKPYTHADHA